MSGYSDLSVYESDAERNAVCAELSRMLRIVPLSTPAADGDVTPPCTPSVAGTSLEQQA